MSSSYTDPLFNDPTFDFAKFAWLCARQMTPAILLRDSEFRVPTEGDIDRAIGDDEVLRSEMRLLDAKTELAVMEARTSEAWEAANQADFARTVAFHEESERCRRDKASKVERMLREVEAWVPPTSDHDTFKAAMVRQLTSEVDQPAVAPTKQITAEYRDSTISYARETVGWRAKHVREAEERVAFRRAWFDALKASIPLPTT